MSKEKIHQWHSLFSLLIFVVWLGGPVTGFPTLLGMWTMLILYFAIGIAIKKYNWVQTAFLAPGFLANGLAIFSNHCLMPVDTAAIEGISLDKWHSALTNTTHFRFLCDTHPILWHAAICSIGDMMILGGMALLLLCFLYHYFFIRYKSYGV